MIDTRKGRPEDLSIPDAPSLRVRSRSARGADARGQLLAGALHAGEVGVDARQLDQLAAAGVDLAVDASSLVRGQLLGLGTLLLGTGVGAQRGHQVDDAGQLALGVAVELAGGEACGFQGVGGQVRGGDVLSILKGGQGASLLSSVATMRCAQRCRIYYQIEIIPSTDRPLLQKVDSSTVFYLVHYNIIIMAINRVLRGR